MKLLLNSGARLAVLDDKARAQEESERRKHRRASGDPKIFPDGARRREAAKREDQQRRRAGGQCSQLRQLLAKYRRPGRPGEKNNRAGQQDGKQQQRGVGQTAALQAGCGTAAAWPRISIAATDAADGASMTPRSVMMAVTYLAGVTSNAGFSTSTS